MSIIKEITKDIKQHIKNAGYEVDNFVLSPSQRTELGDYQINDAMTLAREYKKNPNVIANDIVTELSKDARLENINVAGPGFINITLSKEFLVKSLNIISSNLLENIDKKEYKKIIIDFGGANVAKSLHVGHLRSAILGQSLKNLGTLLGYEMIGDAHLGDYGRPLGLVILEISKMYPELSYFDASYQGDYKDIELNITNKDLELIYPKASNKAKEDEKYLEEAREITYKIQSKTRGYYDLWKKIIEISKEDIKKTYSSLGVSYELWLGESDSVPYIDELTSIIEEKNILKESEGAQIIDVIEENETSPMPPVIYKSSTGAATYATTDLATILMRKKEQNPDEIWYCIDSRQSLHIEQVFRVCKKIHLFEKEKLIHIGFGTMNGPDKKPFKTRDGGIMKLEDLISLVKEETYKRITNNSLTEEEKLVISTDTAIATLKYSDFLPIRTTDYVFDIKKFAELEGKTGPYIMYSTIRMSSLLEKAKEIKVKEISKITTPEEKELSIQILKLPLILDKTLETKSMNEITEYIYKLTSIYNKFYSENKILTEEDESKKESWILLTKVVYDINILLLNVLGIKLPKKM